MPWPATSSRKYDATKRLPTRRPYMSGKTAITVSMSPAAMRRVSSSRLMRPCISGFVDAWVRGSVDGPSRPRTLEPTHLSYVYIHRLPLRVRIERLQSELASDAAAFHAAERFFEMHARSGVDGEITGFDGAGDTHRAGDVARPDRARQAVHRIVRQLDGLRFVAERHHRDDRPEDLLAHDRHLRLHIDEHRRLEVCVAADVPAGGQRRAFALARFDVADDALAMRRGDQRTHLRFVRERLADFHFLKRVDERFREAVVDRLMHEDAAARAAILARVAEGRGDRGGDGAIEIAIVEDHVRRFPAELQRDALDVVGGGAHHVHADFGRAGERDLAHQRMTDQRFADDGALSRHDGEHAFRHACLERELRDLQ